MAAFQLPGPLSDQLWRHLENFDSPPPPHGFGRRRVPTDLVFDQCILIQARDEG